MKKKPIDLLWGLYSFNVVRKWLGGGVIESKYVTLKPNPVVTSADFGQVIKDVSPASLSSQCGAISWHKGGQTRACKPVPLGHSREQEA